MDNTCEITQISHKTPARFPEYFSRSTPAATGHPVFMRSPAVTCCVRHFNRPMQDHENNLSSPGVAVIAAEIGPLVVPAGSIGLRLAAQLRPSTARPVRPGRSTLVSVALRPTGIGIIAAGGIIPGIDRALSSLLRPVRWTRVIPIIRIMGGTRPGRVPGIVNGVKVRIVSSHWVWLPVWSRLRMRIVPL
jgi:hypothetical protein